MINQLLNFSNKVRRINNLKGGGFGGSEGDIKKLDLNALRRITFYRINILLTK